MKPTLCALFALVACSSLRAAFPTLHLKKVCDDQLHAPTVITHAGDGSGRLFICDQMGKIYIFQGGMLLPTPFLNIAAATNAAPNNGPGPVIGVGTGYSERGLLGLCFHPDFENSSAAGYRCFYVNYSAAASHPTLNPVGAGGSTDNVTVIAEYKVSATNPNVADPASARIVLTYGQPQSNHNGGQLEFGPDGFLYIGSGDGGGSMDNQLGHTQGVSVQPASPNQRVTGSLGNGQDRRTLLGKILRINPLDPDGAGPLTYSIPGTNPFISLTQDFTDNALDGAMRGEIYAYGMRNPWKFCFDDSFGGSPCLICADVGQGDVEELDFITSGGNFGWRIKEGSVDFDTITAYGGSPPTVIPPFAEYAHPSATLAGTGPMPKLGTSITGGYVYRGSAIPDLEGKYLCADYAFNGIGGGNGILIGVEETSPGVFSQPVQVSTTAALPSASRIYCFGVDESGEMYMGTKVTSGVLGLSGGLPAGTIWKIQGMETVSAQLPANRDNTIFQQAAAPWKSNGAGPHTFSGKTGSSAGEAVRRQLTRFDLSSIPAGATLTSASVTYHVNLQVGEGFPMTLHKLTADWGEAGSNAGSSKDGVGANAQNNDATWAHRFYHPTTPVNWTTPGGDYTPAASATHNVTNFLSEPANTWSGGNLLADVQGWLAAPATNFGWILIGDESMAYTAQRLISRENASTSMRPRLDVTYTSLPAPSFFETWITTYYPSLPAGTFIDPAGDSDGDTISNLLEYALNYSPVSRNAVNVLGVTLSDDGMDTTISATFRRDPRATDLSYELQASDDLVQWDTVVTSTGGGIATGPAFVSDTVISGEEPMRLVTAQGVLPGLDNRSFIRLKITRAP